MGKEVVIFAVNFVILLASMSFVLAQFPNPDVEIISPTPVTYSTPIIDLDYTFSTPDLGMVRYSINDASNTSIDYELGDTTYIDATALGNLSGMHADNTILGVSSSDGNLYVLNKITNIPAVLVGIPTSPMLTVFGDEMQIYGGNLNGIIGVWDAFTFALVTPLFSDGTPVFRLYADDNFLFAASGSGNISVWLKNDLSNPAFPVMLTNGEGTAMRDVYTDELYIYGASADGKLYIWNKANGLFLIALEDSTGPLFAVRSSEDFIHSGGQDGFMYVWNKTTGVLHNTCNIFGEMYQFDKDGDLMLIADEFGDVTVCTLDGNLVEFHFGQGGLNLGIAADNDFIYTANVDGHVQVRSKNRESVILNAQQGSNSLMVIAEDNAGHEDMVIVDFIVEVPFPEVSIFAPEESVTYNSSSVGLSWTNNVPDLSYASYSLNGGPNVTFDSFFKPVLLENIHSEWASFEIYADDNYFYSADLNNNRINVFNKTDTNFVTFLNDGNGISYGVTADDDFIYEANGDCKIHIYNKDGFTMNTTLDEGVGGINCAINSVYVDEDYIYGGWQAGGIIVWNKTTRVQVAEVDTIYEGSFSIKSDSDYIYSSDIDNSFFGGVRVYNKTNFSEVSFLVSPDAGIMNEIAIDANYIYGAKQGPSGNSGSIEIWHRSNFSYFRTLDESESDVRGLHVDDHYIYGTDSFNTETFDLLIWDKTTFELLYRLTDPDYTIADVFVDDEYIYVGLAGAGFGGIFLYNSIVPLDKIKSSEGANNLMIYVNDTFGNGNTSEVNYVVDTELVFDLNALSSDVSDTIIEFTVLNNHLPNGDFTWGIDFGDGNVVNSSQPINLENLQSVVVIAQHVYDSIGSYNVIASATNGTISDSKTLVVNAI